MSGYDELDATFGILYPKLNTGNPTQTHRSLTLHQKSVRFCGHRSLYEW